MMKQGAAVVAGAVVAMCLAGCGSSAGEAAAQEAYDACVKPDAKVQVLQREGKAVVISVKGDDARALAGMEDDAGAILSGDEASGDGLAIGLSVILAQDCMIEQTGYPGSSDQLADGDEWDGWKFEEESGAGSEFTATFTATK